MKKFLRIITATSFLFILGNVNAQIDGLTNNAPDFTEYDINGVEHSLYADYLDKGIPVIIDVMAYWCPPCWSYSTGGALECLWEEHGFSATGDSTVMIFMVDGDAAATIDHLNGGAGSQGDWISITNYPIFGGDSGLGPEAGAFIGDLYEITYFPTVYLIHPDRTVEEMGQVNCATATSEVANVNQLSTVSNDLSLTYAYPLKTACPDGELTFDFLMKNQSDTTMTSAQIDVEVDGNVISTYNWTGSMDPYELKREDYTFTLTGISNGEHDLDLVVNTVNGVADEDASNNIISNTLNLKNTDSRYYTLTVQTDGAANETNWFVKNAEDVIIYKRDDFTDGEVYENNELYTHELDLREATCYKLIALDSDGDGMTGYLNLKDDNNQLMAHFSVEGSGTENSWQSTVVSAISELKNGYVSFYPNPVKDQLNIDYTVSGITNVSYEILNILGQSVKTKNLGMSTISNIVSINTSDLEGGVYLVNVKFGDETITHRMIK